MTRAVRALVVPLIIGAVAMLFGGVAGAQQPPSFDAPDTAAPGETITLSGGGCTGNFGVASVLQSTGEQVLSARVPVQPGGGWEGMVVVPANAAPGTYTLLVVCLNTDQTVFSYAPRALTVVAPTGAAAPAGQATATDAAATNIPRTGATTLPTVVVAAVLLLAGGALVVFTRRPRPVS